MKYIFIFLGAFCSLYAEYIPFEEGFFKYPKNLRCRKEFSLVYEKNHFRHVKEGQENRIPKIIHHVWLGSKLPIEYEKIVASWKNHHPEWEHIIWTDKDIGSFPLVTGEIINKVKNHGQRSDIFRLEILNRFGGLYVDTDFLCLKPHDIIHKCCDFYTSLGKNTVYIGIMGSVPYHSIVTQYLDAIKQRASFKSDPDSIMKDTGPKLFMNVVCNYICENQDGVLIFPPIYHYPFPADLRYYYWSKNQDFSVVKPFITEHAYAVHLWACSWTKLRLQQNKYDPDFNRRFPCQKTKEFYCE